MDALRPLRGTPSRPSSFGAPLRALREASERVPFLLRAAYVFPPFWFATHLDLLRPLLDPPPMEPIWPVAWLELVDPSVGAPLIMVFGLAAAMLGALMPERRWVRAAVFFGMLEVLALQYSFGKIHHLMHGWLYALGIWAAFVPDVAFRPDCATRAERAAGLLGFSAARYMLALTYSLAGLGKLLGSLYQLFMGQVTPLHPSSLAIHVADRLVQTYPRSILGPFMIEHGTLQWPLMLLTLYLQTFALWAAFRPALFRVWGVGLIGFHVVTGLSLTIDFTPNILLLGVLFVASPEAPHQVGWKEVARALPGAGWLRARAK